MDRPGLYRGRAAEAKQGLAPGPVAGPDFRPMDTQTPADPFAVTSEDQLRALYAQPLEGPLKKVAHRIEATARAWIAASPFCILSTVGSRGVHATPRGDAPGFVAVEPDGTLLIPDRRGNNRLDALRDIIEDNRVSVIFFVPGASEVLRVHGTARITADPALHRPLRRTRQGAGHRAGGERERDVHAMRQVDHAVAPVGRSCAAGGTADDGAVGRIASRRWAGRCRGL